MIKTPITIKTIAIAFASFSVFIDRRAIHKKLILMALARGLATWPKKLPAAIFYCSAIKKLISMAVGQGWPLSLIHI